MAQGGSHDRRAAAAGPFPGLGGGVVESQPVPDAGLPGHKHALAGDLFFSAEKMLGAWGANCTAAGRYDWDDSTAPSSWCEIAAASSSWNCPRFKSDLPTNQLAAAASEVLCGAAIISARSTRRRYPKHLAQDQSAALLARNDDGTLRIFGGVQLFNPAVAQAYGEYLQAMAENLRRQGLYEAIAAVHLEMGEAAELDEQADYSDLTRQRWQAFLAKRYRDIAAFNSAAGTSYRSFPDVPLPLRELQPRAAHDWQASLPFRWHAFLKKQYDGCAHEPGARHRL